MDPTEQFILAFIQIAAPLAANLFIHSSKSIAVFNASDNLFNGIVQALTQQQAQVAAQVKSSAVTIDNNRLGAAPATVVKK